MSQYVLLRFPMLGGAALPCGRGLRMELERFLRGKITVPRQQLCRPTTVWLGLRSSTEYSVCQHRTLSTLQIGRAVICGAHYLLRSTYPLWNIIGCRFSLIEVCRRLVLGQFDNGYTLFNEST